MSLFIARQLWLQRTDGPLLDLRTFTFPGFTIGVVLMGVSMMALFGTIILLPIYAQNVLGLEALGTGLLLLPGACSLVCSPRPSGAPMTGWVRGFSWYRAPCWSACPHGG